MDNFRNSEQNNQNSRELRDNFKNIEEFMNSQSYGNKDNEEKQLQQNRDMRDNFKNIKEFMNKQNYTRNS